jgi:hypothetical protein
MRATITAFGPNRERRLPSAAPNAIAPQHLPDKAARPSSGVRRERGWLEFNAVVRPIEVHVCLGDAVLRAGIAGQRTLDCRQWLPKVITPVLKQRDEQYSSGGSHVVVLTGVSLRLRKSGHNCFGPRYAVAQGVGAIDRDAPRMVQPPIASTAQDLADFVQFDDRIETVGNDVVSDHVGAASVWHVGQRRNRSFHGLGTGIRFATSHRLHLGGSQQQQLHNKVMDQLPEGNSNHFASKVATRVDVLHNRQCRTVDVIPNHHKHWKVLAKTHPDCRGHEVACDTGLPGLKRRRNLGRVAETGRLLDLWAFAAKCPCPCATRSKVASVCGM